VGNGDAGGQAAGVRAAVVPGEGIALRRGPLTAVIAPGPAADAVLSALDAVLAEPDPAAALQRRLVSLVATSDEVPPFAALVEGSDHVALVVHGAMRVEGSSAAAPFSHSGLESALCLTASLARPLTEVALLPEGAVGSAGVPGSSLREGVIPATGLVLGGADTPAQPGPQTEDPAPATVRLPSSATVDIPGGSVERPSPPPPPAHVPAAGVPTAGVPTAGVPTAGVPTAHEPATPQPVVVEGVECANRHFNHPFALRCATCGLSLLGSTRHTVKGPRPPLGTLTFEDGLSVVLDADYVVGREPDHDPAVLAGEARPLVIDDPEHLVSRVHAEVRILEWDVTIVDRGSANGVAVLHPESSGWERLDAGERVVISPGTQLSIGKKVLTYDAEVADA
jgi:hypothetical protein